MAEKRPGQILNARPLHVYPTRHRVRQLGADSLEEYDNILDHLFSDNNNPTMAVTPDDIADNLYVLHSDNDYYVYLEYNVFILLVYKNVWLFHDSCFAENSTQYFWGQKFFQQEASIAMEMCTIHIAKS